MDSSFLFFFLLFGGICENSNELTDFVSFSFGSDEFAKTSDALSYTAQNFKHLADGYFVSPPLLARRFVLIIGAF